MVYKLNTLTPTLYPFAGVYCGLPFKLTWGNLVPWMLWGSGSLHCFARRDGAGTPFKRSVMLMAKQTWEVLGLWSICQKYSVEWVSIVFWEVKCTVIGIKQKGSVTVLASIRGNSSWQVEWRSKKKKKKCQKTKEINALFTLPETLCSTDPAAMIFFFMSPHSSNCEHRLFINMSPLRYK